MRKSVVVFCFGLMLGCGPAATQQEEAASAQQAKDSPADGKGTPAPSPDAAASEIVFEATGLPEPQQRDGVIALFDGTSLFGWHPNAEGTGWQVRDGAIVCEGGAKSLLVTDVPWADFELTLEFRIEAGGNSGVFVRSLEVPKDTTQDCYEVNIAATHPRGFTTGAIVDRLEATGVDAGDDGGWHQLKVICDGGKVLTFVDGDEGAALMSIGGQGDRRVGHIGLQYRTGAVGFRRVFLRPLNLESLTAEEDWSAVDGSKATFAFERGVSVQGGPGFLQSDREFGDFVLQASVVHNNPTNNSGVFFRAMPGTADAPSNGYEMQVSPEYDGSRDNPSDGGAGAIFRRQNARLVLADVGPPAVQTLVAAGDRMMTWVSGYPVVSFRDDRESHENPRKGRRLTPGHLILQGHDPGTDVAFQTLSVGELPPQ